MQHELMQGMSIDVAYFRHWFRGQYVGNNVAVAASDYDPYCVTAPSDSRLPDGGGYQVCGFYDVKPAKFGQVTNRVGFADRVRDAERGLQRRRHQHQRAADAGRVPAGRHDHRPDHD
ncbi:MAG: hypothetical protein QM736_03325 [Vicinamibacterales bacterium]